MFLAGTTCMFSYGKVLNRFVVAIVISRMRLSE